MKKIKIVAPQWQGYTGSIGTVRFTNGVSDTFVPAHIRQRLSIGMAMVELNANGEEEVLSATQKILDGTALRAPVAEPLKRQTTDEKEKELIDNALKNTKQRPTHTRAELEALADTNGIKGIRDIADEWNVRSKSIPTLINMILDAQERHANKDKSLVVERLTKAGEIDAAIRHAALTGDMAAAINAANKDEQTPQAEAVNLGK